MKHFFLSLSLLITSFVTFSQTQPVKWEFSSNSLGKGEYELVFKATINKGYYMYSQDITDGPMPLEFTFNTGSYQKIGATKPSVEAKEKHDDAFNIKVKYHDGVITFKQKVKASKVPVTVKGNISYQTCSDTGCIPDDVDFAIEVGKKTTKK